MAVESHTNNNNGRVVKNENRGETKDSGILASGMELRDFKVDKSAQLKDDIFKGMNISDTPVDKTRYKCSQCKRSKSIYCSECLLPLVAPPFVELPLHVIMYALFTRFRHPGENAQSSTAGYCKMACPEKVSVFVDNLLNSQHIQEGGILGEDDVMTKFDNCVLLYPCDDALPVQELPSTVDTLVVIDGTWSQAKAMAHILSPKMNCTTLNAYTTKFWRFQSLSDKYLATIEAIYYFFVEYALRNGSYDGRYDNLLYYFKAKYSIIQDHYKTSERRFTKRHALGDSYIKRE